MWGKKYRFGQDFLKKCPNIGSKVLIWAKFLLYLQRKTMQIIRYENRKVSRQSIRNR